MLHAVVAAALVVVAAADPTGAVVEAKKKPRSILLLDLSSSASVDPATQSAISNTLPSSVQKHPGLSVLTGQDVKRMAQIEADKQLLGCDTASASCIAEIAGAMGADLVLYGDVGKLGDLFIVNLNLFDAGKQQALGRQTVQVKAFDESFITQLDIAVTALLAPITGEKSAVTLTPTQGAAVPTIDIEALKASGLKSINMKAEHALEAALDAQEDAKASPEKKRDAWCALAIVEGANPYLDAANKACTQWKQYVVANNALEKSLAADYETLSGFLGLKHKTSEQKLQALDAFLQTYERISDRPMVKSVKRARERLTSTGSASLDDGDKDGLTDDIDKCPSAAEDFDSFEDDDGCPDDDNDKDGVLDDKDKCRDEAGVAEKDGCPQTLGDVAEKAGNAAGDFLHEALDFYAFDFDRPVMLRAGAGVDTTFAPLGAHLSPGGAVGLHWAALDLGVRGEYDLDKPSAFLLGGHLGVQGLQIPRGEFALLDPSVGVDVLGDPAQGEFLAGPYVANRFRASWVALTVRYRYAIFDAGGSELPEHMIGAELSLQAPFDSLKGAVSDNDSDAVDVFAFDFKRDPFLGFTGTVQTAVSPFGEPAGLGFGLALAWGMFEAGGRMELELSESDTPIVLGGYAGLAAVQIPKGDIGILRPSVGVDGSFVADDSGGSVIGPYIANTFNFDVLRIRVFYRYGLLRDGSLDFGEHTVGAEMQLDFIKLAE